MFGWRRRREREALAREEWSRLAAEQASLKSKLDQLERELADVAAVLVAEHERRHAIEEHVDKLDRAHGDVQTATVELTDRVSAVEQATVTARELASHVAAMHASTSTRLTSIEADQHRGSDRVEQVVAEHADDRAQLERVSGELVRLSLDLRAEVAKAVDAVRVPRPAGPAPAGDQDVIDLTETQPLA